MVGEHPQEKNTQPVTWIRPSFEALLDNIRSVHNVGSMFRTADGAGVVHLHLCGMTATPANIKLTKAALGAQERVSWSYHPNAVDQAEILKENGYQLWAIEDVEDANPFFAANPVLPHSRVAVIVGNERAGVDPGIIQICDHIYSLPMAGYKDSLNVAVSFGIVAYHLCYAAEISPEDREFPLNTDHVKQE
jgi:tRNA G18 (ribose-2'-O)-methylase SpoU